MFFYVLLYFDKPLQKMYGFMKTLKEAHRSVSLSGQFDKVPSLMHLLLIYEFYGSCSPTICTVL